MPNVRNPLTFSVLTYLDYVVGNEILYDGRLYANLVTVLGCVTGENTVYALSYSVAPNSKMLARFFSLASEEGLVEVARLDGSTVEELCGEHGQRLYDQHCDGDPCDVCNHCTTAPRKAARRRWRRVTLNKIILRRGLRGVTAMALS